MACLHDRSGEAAMMRSEVDNAETLKESAKSVDGRIAGLTSVY